MIPEVNPEAMAGMKAGQGGIVANPNCSTIIALMAVTPLHRAARIKRMVVSTYQARASSRLCHACVLHHRRARGGDACCTVRHALSALSSACTRRGACPCVSANRGLLGCSA